MAIPQRTCVGCRLVAERNQLLRWVLDPQRPHRLVADPTRSASGRGVWLHPDAECARQAVRRRAFARAFRSGAVEHDLDALLAVMREVPRPGNPTPTVPTESGSGPVETR